MKKSKTLINKLICVFCFLAVTTSSQAQVLDLVSTTEGALLPRMTSAERTAITTPSDSETVYDTDTNSYWYWDNMAWNEIAAVLPRITSAERTAIATPLDSETVYDTDTNSYWYWDDMAWNEIAINQTVLDTIATGSATPAGAIPDFDFDGVSDTIALTEPGVIGPDKELKVCLNISHTWVQDIDVTLISPDGTTMIDLTSDNGGTGDNYTETCFSDFATNSITSGTPPYTGTYKPEEPLSTFYGQSIAGDWILNVVDDENSILGTLNSWSIEVLDVKRNLPSFITDNDGDTKVEVLDNDKINLVSNNNLVMKIDSFVKLGEWDEGYAGDSIQMLLSGSHNMGANSNLSRNAYKLLIEGYNNDPATYDAFPIYLRDENQNVDFYIKSQKSSSENTLAYFRGNVAIGVETPTPSGKLHIKQELSNQSALVLENNGSGNDYWEWEIGTDNLNLYFDSDGSGPNVKVLAAYIDDVDGSWNPSSDIRLKKDILPIEDGILGKLLQVTPSSFRYKHASSDVQKTLGFIAQEVQAVLPEAVKTREDGMLAMNYNDMAVLAVKAIQEQQIKFDEMLEESISQREEIEFLKAEIEAIKASINK